MTKSTISTENLHIPLQYGDLPYSWKWLRLDDLCEGIFDCPHSTPNLTENGPLIARTQDIITGVFIAHQAGHVSESTYLDRISRATPTPGDLLYSREGTYFGVAAEIPYNTKVCLGQRMVLIRPNSQQLNPSYLRFWLNSRIMSDHIHGFRDGSVAERLNMPTIRSLPILTPPLPIQKRIARTLGTLDDKIEINRRINATLEAMARALFRSWFIDFDPVRARMRGRQPVGMDSATAALFPDSFEESPLGPIPTGWKTGRIRDIAENPRRSIKPEKIDPTSPYIALEHMPKRSISLENWDTAEGIASGKLHFNRCEILFGKLRPYFHKVGVPAISGICSTDILVIVPKTPEWFGLTLGHVSSDELVHFTDQASTGTKMPRTNWKDISSFEIAIPPTEIASALTKFTKPLISRIHDNIHQSRTLASLRDTLLPKFLSGELSVDESELPLEAAEAPTP